MEIAVSQDDRPRFPTDRFQPKMDQQTFHKSLHVFYWQYYFCSVKFALAKLLYLESSQKSKAMAARGVWTLQEKFRLNPQIVAQFTQYMKIERYRYRFAHHPQCRFVVHCPQICVHHPQCNCTGTRENAAHYPQCKFVESFEEIDCLLASLTSFVRPFQMRSTRAI